MIKNSLPRFNKKALSIKSKENYWTQNDSLTNPSDNNFSKSVVNLKPKVTK